MAETARVPPGALHAAVVGLTAAMASTPPGLNAAHPPAQWQRTRAEFTKRVTDAADWHLERQGLQDKWAAYRPFLGCHQDLDTDLIVDVTADLMARFRARPAADPAQDWVACVQVLPEDVPRNMRLLGHKDDGGLPNAQVLLSKLRPFYGVARFLGIDMKDLTRGASDTLQEMNMSSSGYLLRAAYGTVATLSEVRKADNVFQIVGTLFATVLEGVQSPSFLLLALWNALLDLVNFGAGFTQGAQGWASSLSAITGMLGAMTSVSQLKALVYKMATAAMLLLLLVLGIWFLPYQTAYFAMASVTVTAARALYDSCGAFLDDVWRTVKAGLSALGSTVSAVKDLLPEAALNAVETLGKVGATVAGWVSSAWQWVKERLAGPARATSYRDAIEYAAAAAQFAVICRAAAPGGGSRGGRYFAVGGSALCGAPSLAVHTACHARRGVYRKGGRGRRRGRGCTVPSRDTSRHN
jgi:hypothetical protein